jgi:serine-type D-Ala-D-Ala carboxypeptidase/endopeptidase (penicillin-binding protein 4)
MHLRTLALLILLLPGCAALARPLPPPATAPTRAPGLAATLDAIFADTAARHAHWGVHLVSLATGQTLYRHGAEQAFMPASTLKVITGAAALTLLGADFRYQTRFSATGTVRAGVLQGDLVIRGSGDPTLSGRFGGDPRAPIRAWADSLRARGITRVAGGIVGVDSAFVGPTLGSGWAWDDLPAAYSAEVGALQFNEGALELQVIPGAIGSPAIVLLEPFTQYVPVLNQTITAPPGATARLEISRDPRTPAITVSGVVPADTPAVVQRLAIRGPTDFFLAVARETLREAGVVVEGQALAVNDWPELRNPALETPLFTHLSPSLREILPAVLRPSQNQIAETLLRTLGRERGGEGSARAGVAVVDSLLRAWELPVQSFRMADGSGLSRYSLLTPELLSAVLVRMSTHPEWELWSSSLPIAGQTGTLANRMRDPPLAGRVHAKTGTLTGVRGLSGYLRTEAGETLVFTFLVNNHLRPAAVVDRVMEAALAEAATAPASR